MGELVIVDNPDVEVAALVDIDDYKAHPIVAAGPERVTILQAFVDSVPFDLGLLGSFEMRDAFVQFLEHYGALAQVQTQEDGSPQVESSGSNGSDAEAALAEHEATNATDTVAEQPADTDTEAAQDTKTVQVRCWNCNGEGTITFGEGGGVQKCNMCYGTGKVTQVLAS